MSGKKGGGDDEVIFFTPGAGFDIEKAAPSFAEMMIDEGRPLLVRLPNNMFVEFEPGCTPEEIVAGFERALTRAQKKYTPSNTNTEGAPPAGPPKKKPGGKGGKGGKTGKGKKGGK